MCPAASGPLIEKILKAAPAAAKKADKRGRMPLHYGMWRQAPVDVVKKVLKAFPEAAEELDSDMKMPLDYEKEKGSRGAVIAAVENLGSAAKEAEGAAAAEEAAAAEAAEADLAAAAKAAEQAEAAAAAEVVAKAEADAAAAAASKAEAEAAAAAAEAAAAAVEKDPFREMCDELFRQMDKNGDGNLTKKEISRGLKQLKKITG
eukprot:SAG11_NODE_8792_length_975_cov_1.624429_1_plen_204_part_00